MLKADGGLRSIVRSNLRHVGSWMSIETGLTEQGVADLNVIIMGGREVWIECKRAYGWEKPTFKPAQPGWLFTRWRYGGNALIFTRRLVHPKRREKDDFDELYVTSAQHARELKDRGLRAVPHLLVCHGGPSMWPWVKIEHIVRHFTSSAQARTMAASPELQHH